MLLSLHLKIVLATLPHPQQCVLRSLLYRLCYPKRDTKSVVISYFICIELWSTISEIHKNKTKFRQRVKRKYTLETIAFESSASHPPQPLSTRCSLWSFFFLYTEMSLIISYSNMPAFFKVCTKTSNENASSVSCCLIHSRTLRRSNDNPLPSPFFSSALWKFLCDIPEEPKHLYNSSLPPPPPFLVIGGPSFLAFLAGPCLRRRLGASRPGCFCPVARRQ